MTTTLEADLAKVIEAMDAASVPQYHSDAWFDFAHKACAFFRDYAAQLRGLVEQKDRASAAWIKLSGTTFDSEAEANAAYAGWAMEFGAEFLQICGKITGD